MNLQFDPLPVGHLPNKNPPKLGGLKKSNNAETQHYILPDPSQVWMIII